MTAKTSALTPWLQHIPVVGGADDSHAVIFPHAGGGPRFYRELSLALARRMNVWIAHYPGRERRIGDPLPESLPSLAKRLAEEIASHVPGPYRLFGHSMGATVALECARRLPRRVESLIVSASPAPHARGFSRIHTLGDDEFIAEIQGMGATPIGVLAHPELRALVIPILRNDYRMVETYTADTHAIVDTPIVAYASLDDPTVSTEAVSRWSECTTGLFALRTFPGDHFYFQTALEDVVDSLSIDLFNPVLR